MKIAYRIVLVVAVAAFCGATTLAQTRTKPVAEEPQKNAPSYADTVHYIQERLYRLGAKMDPTTSVCSQKTGDQILRATGMAQLHDHIIDLRVDVDLSVVKAGAYSLGLRQVGPEWTRYPIRVF
jgi:hypothetical protein